jgi:predicted AAA+ superfamily ATPase
MKRKITQQFIAWKKNGAQKPLLVYGARQVGKSYAIIDFGQSHYEQILEVNFERNETAKNIFTTDLEPTKIIKALEGLFSTQIDQGNTLIFFDEIQKCPRALTSLKYFAEDKKRGKNNYHLIAAGSLLGVVSQREHPDDGGFYPTERTTFPVGKVEEVIAQPMDFEEFLWASGQTWLIEQIRGHYQDNSPMESTLHEQALSLYRIFLVVGGMPEAVEQYLDGKNYQAIHKNIIADYVSDMTKYCAGAQALRNIDTYNSIPTQLSRENKKFTYTAIKKDANGRTHYPSILWLKDARVALRCFKSTKGDIPPKASEDKNCFKFYLSDTGLLCYQLQINEANLEVFNQNFRGAITENFVACALQNKIESLTEELHYWKNDEKKGSAEVDFLLSTDQGTIPLEVKSSENVQAKSMRVFINRFKPRYGIRTSTKNFGFENAIKSVPLYALFCLEGIL